MAELAVEKKLITDPSIPLRSYNYSYIRGRLEEIYSQKVSLPSIITRAKTAGFYVMKKEKKAHDREVLTNYAGNLSSMTAPTTGGVLMLSVNGILLPHLMTRAAISFMQSF